MSGDGVVGMSERIMLKTRKFKRQERMFKIYNIYIAALLILFPIYYYYFSSTLNEGNLNIFTSSCYICFAQTN